MKKLLVLLFLPMSAIADECTDLTRLELTDATIQEVELVQEPAPHCKARGFIGGKIGFSLWLPLDWNGRFVMGGAGGFVRPEDNQAITFSAGSVLTSGYATASSDTGHQGHGLDNSWGLNNLEAIVNYGHLGMHRTVVTAKQAIEAHYDRAPEKSFFVGCSNGGRQALHEAQRYPSDFDGIVAGAPALDFTGVASAFVAITQAMYPDHDSLSSPLVTKQDRALLRSAIENQCDQLDGLPDGILHDPTACTFDPASLQCSDGPAEDCLSAAKVAAIKTVYDGPRDSRRSLHAGFPFGAENIDANGWGSWLTGGNNFPPSAAYAFGMGTMRNFALHDASWSYENYNWENYRSDTAALAPVLNAENADLSAFRDQGGKLLLFHGWADVALSGHMTTDYVDNVYGVDSSARDDVRLFMMPGVLHCFGGPGPSLVDWLNAIETWHDSGTAPDQLAAAYPERDGARTICAWPQKARYTSGNPDSPDSYVCE